MSDLLKDRIRAHRSAPDVYDPPSFEDMARRIEELEAENHLLKTSGIAEVAVRNPNVMEYMKHWEGRAETAEAKLAKAVERLDKLAYWLDIDQELWDAFTVMEKSDHRHMQSEVKTVKNILTGGKG